MQIIERTKERTRVYTVNDEPSLTQQQFKEQCDINNIIDRYTKTGELPMSYKVGRYLDTTEIPDYQGALDIVLRADAAFMELPAKIRERFKNDPSEMLEFLKDQKNTDEAIKLGLIDPPKQTNEQNPKQTNEQNSIQKSP